MGLTGSAGYTGNATTYRLDERRKGFGGYLRAGETGRRRTGPSAPQLFLAGSGGRMAGNRGLHAGRHACPGGQAVLVPDSLPADQRSFFATSAMFILSLCRAAK